MEFKKIETQEEFDALVKERIVRERANAIKDFSDYEEIKKKNAEYVTQIQAKDQQLTDLTGKYANYDSSLADLNSKIKRYESDSAKTRIALELGLPYEFAGRLSGEDEAAIRKDAEALSKFVGNPVVAPVGTLEKQDYKTSDAAYQKLVDDLNTK